MKIIYVENVRIPSVRAHAYQIIQTVAWLGRLGHDVTLVNPDRAKGADVFSYFGLRNKTFIHVLLPTWDFLAIRFLFVKPFAYVLQRFSFLRSLRAWARGKTPNVWYTRDPAMIDGLRGVVKGPWILELHDTPDYDAVRWARVKPLVSGYVAITIGLKMDLMKRFGIPENKIAVAPDGFDPVEFETKGDKIEIRRENHFPQDAFIAIYTGSFYDWKGVDLVVRAWAKTPERAHLFLVGGPERDRHRLERLIDPVVRERIRIIPALPRKESTALLAVADIGLLTSSPAHDIARRYTSPIKQFEYMAAGLPILASDVPSSHEALNPAIASFYNSTEQGFLDKLNQVMEDAVWRRAASSTTLQIVKRYAWEARARRIAEFIEQILSVR
jgi:glycosyltransferase involved in cell wall biosynthesis